MKEIGSRIRTRRIALGLSQEELALKLGYKSRASINKIELGLRNLTQSKIKSIADALDTTPSYIMGWSEDITPPTPSLSNITNIVSISSFKKIPVLGTIACGEPILAEENLDGEIDISDNISADFALKCKGDSMSPTFLHGDTVLIRQQPTVLNGQIAAVLIDNEATLKHVYLEPERMVLSPDNHNFPPLILTGENINTARILGLATGFIRALPIGTKK